jgi:MFS family permease
MKPSLVTANRSGLGLVFRTLRYRNYRLFFVGQGISLVGTWMQQVAMTWLVYRLTGSAFLLGIVGFASQMPSAVLSPIAGVLADRLDRRRILVATQTLAMLQAAVLAVLTLTQRISVSDIVLLSVVLGFCNAFDIPTRQSFVLDMVEKKEDLGNAIALNSSLFNTARLVGPSVAGLVIVALGEGLCFVLNALSFLAVIAALLAMRIPPRARHPRATGVLQGIRDGFAYAFGFPPIRYILLLIALVSLLGMPYSVLMPVFARDILHGGPKTLGFLLGATGVGALTGAAYLASRRHVLGLGRLIPLSTATFSCGLIGFSFSRNQSLSLAMLFFVGIGMMLQMASSNTILQTIVDDDKRGRVMSLFAVSFMGVLPFGNLLVGALASGVGAPRTLLLGGIVCLLGAVLFARKLPMLRKETRPAYARLGILPEAVNETGSPASRG